MRTPFKLKSGNTSSFKNMGASPAKQSNPSSWYKGSKSANASMNIDLSLESKKAQAQKLTKVKKPTSTLNRVTKALKNTSKQLVKPGLKVAKQITKRFLGPVGVALTGYEVGEYVYKNRKEISKQAKKVKKRRMNNPGDHGRPKY